ncbi:MAG: leucine-rich repeat domain-containing protein [Clostridia bacterium]|nr:leucine-rich repeat domain-containing protein [Clostridia bacterium]
MKNKKRFLKLIAVITVAMIMVFSLASCAMGGGTSSASDANGTHGSLTWDYKKDGQTLTITGSGTMTSFTGTEDVAWADVVTSVKKVVVGSGVTTVGDYAFFGMTQLSEVSLPDTVTAIGKLSFAYTPALTGIDLPDSLSSVGYGAFETSGLTAIALPASVTAISDRAFMYCNDLTAVTGSGVMSVGAEAFAYCSALDSIKLAEGATASATAFDNAKTNKITVVDNKITIIYKFVDAADTAKDIKASESVSMDANAESYIYKAPEIAGYTAVKTDIMVTPTDVNQTVVVTYNKVEEEPETEAPVDTDQTAGSEDDGKLEPMTIVALVVTVLIIIGIIVGTILFIRHDKKNAGKGTTVRKNKDEKGANKDKKNTKNKK